MCVGGVLWGGAGVGAGVSSSTIKFSRQKKADLKAEITVHASSRVYVVEGKLKQTTMNMTPDYNKAH